MFQTRGPVALLRLGDLVGLKDRLRVHHRDVLPSPPQGDTITLREPRDVMKVQRDRQAEELLFWQSHARNHRVVGGLVHETDERAEGAIQQAKHVASLALVELDTPDAGGNELLGLLSVFDEEVHEASAMRGARIRRARVDAALRLVLAYESAGPLCLVRPHRHRGMHVAKGLENVVHGRWGAARQLLLGCLPEGLPEIHFRPRKLGQVPLRGLDRGLCPEDVVVRAVDGHLIVVCVADDV
mmetsp:Transcript_5158/g.12806  ORF Transcript_5158/g.12806 Transcript_5158/m.12806 type:complete len:241 (-) Transcript_5158:652-1374(-)